MARHRSSPHPGRHDAATVASFRRHVAPLVRVLWPHEVHGLERLPARAPYLVVANHSGMGVAEVLCLVTLWAERFGADRPVAAMAHSAALRVPWLGPWLRRLGAVEATREGAAAAVRAGAPLLVFPGGDHEAMRPLWQADRVDFAGRKGWIRLAREHRLPIVPLAITGSHVTMPILARSRLLAWLGARLLGVRRVPVPAHTAALTVAVAALADRLGAPAWGAAAAAYASLWMVPTVLLPFVPSRIGFYVGAPISPEALGPDVSCDDELYARVVGTLQAVLDAHPTFPRLRRFLRKGAALDAR